jgi:hypothetical protein
MPDRPQTPDETAHDVLAAEEFGVPAPDPALHRDEVHDVLAAEEFVVPAPDPTFHHGPVMLPDDPSGISDPHDVLAAEEFALPAGHATGSLPPEGRAGSRALVAAGTAAALALLLRKRRS